MLIDTKISEMNKSFGDISCLNIILICSKSSEPFLEHIDLQRVVACYHHVYTQVIFEVVYQVRVKYILRH
jgi:hypothetical protein